jgi:hypothetical protein
MQNLLAASGPAHLEPDRLRDPRRSSERDPLLDLEAAGEPDPSRDWPFFRASTGDRERLLSRDLDLSRDFDLERDADLPRDLDRERDRDADLPSRDLDRERDLDLDLDLSLDLLLDLDLERDRPSSVILK